jgi:hypothetical protein
MLILIGGDSMLMFYFFKGMVLMFRIGFVALAPRNFELNKDRSCWIGNESGMS